MKKIYNILCAFLLVGLISCDVIPQGDRIKDVEEDVKDSKRVVLLMDFTAWQCINCPQAAEIIAQIQEQYPQNIVAVGMHPQGIDYTDPKSKGPNFRREEAFSYLQYFGGTTSTPLPSGIINNKEFNKETIIGKEKWIAIFMQERKIEPKCLIDMEADLTGEKPAVSVTLNPTKELDCNISLQMWLIENNIVGYQYMPNGKPIADYNHKHVFRGCINELWGDALGKITEPTTKEYQVEIPQGCVRENCAVVAVVINTDTKEVIQAGEVELAHEQEAEETNE